jgi:hypothetical protein
MLKYAAVLEILMPKAVVFEQLKQSWPEKV